MLDTQVVLDWPVFRDISTAPLAHSLELGSLRWLTSDAMQGELQHVLDRVVASAWGPDRVATSRVIGRLALPCEACDTPRQPLPCSDPDDQMFIDLALDAGAHWLFSRDRALPRLARRARERGVIVLRPPDWHPSMPSANSH